MATNLPGLPGRPPRRVMHLCARAWARSGFSGAMEGLYECALAGEAVTLSTAEVIAVVMALREACESGSPSVVKKE